MLASTQQVTQSTAAKAQAPKEKRQKPSKEQGQKSTSSEAPAPINLSGSGQMATDPFNLESGLSIFRMTHQGSRNFSVKLLDQNGRPAGLDSLLANEIGPFEGSQAVQAKAGQYVLDIQADGPWTVTIEQPRPSTAPQTTSFSGNTKTATDFFELSQGLHKFTMTHQGSRNFSVKVLDKNGASAGLDSLLANEIGPFNGSKAFRASKDDIYLLQVDADGPWTIQVS